MVAMAAVGGDTKTKARGRTQRDGQEAVTRPQVVAEKIAELERLELAGRAAKQVVNDAIKKVAEESGYMASSIKRLVKARVDDKFKDKKRDAEQQLELFNEVGED